MDGVERRDYNIIDGQPIRWRASSTSMSKDAAPRDRAGPCRNSGDEQLLADLDDVDELGRIGVEVDHVAGLLGGLRAGVHRHADVGLGQRRRVVGAVAGHRDEVAARLLACG